jgi:hypothetical protein
MLVAMKSVGIRGLTREVNNRRIRDELDRRGVGLVCLAGSFTQTDVAPTIGSIRTHEIRARGSGAREACANPPVTLGAVASQSRVRQLYSALGHHLLEVSGADRVGQRLANAECDDGGIEVAPPKQAFITAI